MALCAEFHISHSYFLGGPKAWTEDDRAKALSFRRWQSQHCNRCGTRSADWLDEEGQLLDPPRVVVEHHHCPGCEQTEYAARALDRDDAGRIDPPGMGVRVMPYRAVQDKPDLTLIEGWSLDG